MVAKIKRLFLELKNAIESGNQSQKDNLSLQLIKNYLPNKNNFFPHTNSSINHHTIACILNDITINNRLSIIEFGGGSSTLILAKFAKENKIPLKINTVENNLAFLNIIQKSLKKEQLDNVNLIYAKNTKCEQAIDNNHWYDEQIIENSIKDKIDLDNFETNFRIINL